MSGARRPQFNQESITDNTPLPDHIPKVEEIGATSAPLLSASYFIGDRCRAFNDDYMKCKAEAGGRGEVECLREGRKVTRCAASVIKDINTHCMQQFKAHRGLNTCVFEKLGLKKTIPDTPAGQVPVHLRKKQIYANYQGEQY
ncbi:NADH dehydrogenase [ubiquinone] (complex I), alpha subcomplex, subunit 8 [Trichophyton rubrum]|nr:NADH dehydrogenase [ubiquinone] (complex I), alpha subcomplex, subunit 8 [Trichophyton rubrum]